MAVLEKVVDTIKAAFTSRDSLIKALADLDAKGKRAYTERQREIDALQAELDRRDEPVRALARLRDEARSADTRASQKHDELEAQLRAMPSRELDRFRQFLDRLTERARRTALPQAILEHDRVTDETKVVNLDAIERHVAATSGLPDPEAHGRRLPTPLGRAGNEVLRTLWRLPDAAQRERIAQLRAEIAASLEGTALENEL